MLQKLCTAVLLFVSPCLAEVTDTHLRVLVTNEKSGDVSVIDPSAGKVIQTIPVGTRPRGIRVSDDGHFAYVAVSATPIGGPTSASAPAATMASKPPARD